jgi:hypothetical protein
MREDEEMPRQPYPEGESAQRVYRSNVVYEDVKHGLKNSKRKLRFLAIIGLVGLGFYLLIHWFGWVALLGFVSIPAWYMWAVRQIDREAYTVIEVALEGDEYDKDMSSHDTQVSMWSIPPDIWRDYKKKGTPFSPGDRIYICDKIDLEEEIIYFPHDPRFSNLSFWTRLELWLKLKKRLPQLERQLAVYMYDTEQRASEIAFDILREMNVYRHSDQDLVEFVEPKVKRQLKKEAFIHE